MEKNQREAHFKLRQPKQAQIVQWNNQWCIKWIYQEVSNPEDNWIIKQWTKRGIAKWNAAWLD